MKGKHSGRAAELLFCGGNRVCNLVGLVAFDLIREELCFSGYQVAEAVSHAGQGRRVVGLHRQSEGNQQHKVGELGEVKSWAALSTAQGGLDAKPSQKNDRESAEQTEAHGLEQSEVRGQQVSDGLRQERKRIYRHHV